MAGVITTADAVCSLGGHFELLQPDSLDDAYAARGYLGY
jgi:hypothetical protein